MVATSNKGTIEGVTASEFRRKMGAVAEAENDANNEHSEDRMSAIRSQF
jgi:hypothetical protein